MKKRTKLLAVVILCVAALVIAWYLKVSNDNLYDKYLVTGRDENPNLVILVENQSANEQKLAIKVMINNELLAKESLKTQAAENYYLKLPEGEYQLQVEAKGESRVENFVVSSNHQVVIAASYRSTLSLHEEIIP